MPTPEDCLVGTVLDENYVILEKLSTGGFGALYRARHTQLDRVVALKILTPEVLSDSESRQRFKREGKILAGIDHRNVVKFYHFGISDVGCYIAMELLEGISLRQRLSSTSLSTDESLNIAIQICDGLHAVHEHGIIHRDIKPDNVMLVQQDGKQIVKLIDFGLSRVLTSSAVSVTQHLTQTGLLIGSVNYMSPEQCCGQKADVRSDIYALGCLLYEMVTDQQPFEAENPIGLLHMHMHKKPAPLASFEITCPPGLESVITKSLEKMPEKRYQTIVEMKTDLQAIKSGKGAIFNASNKIAKPIQPIHALLACSALIAVSALLWTLYLREIIVEKKGHDRQRQGEAVVKGSPARALSEQAGSPILQRAENVEGTLCFVSITGEKKQYASLGIDSWLLSSDGRLRAQPGAYDRSHTVIIHLLLNDGTVVKLNVCRGDENAMSSMEAFHMRALVPGIRLRCSHVNSSLVEAVVLTPPFSASLTYCAANALWITLWHKDQAFTTCQNDRTAEQLAQFIVGLEPTPVPIVEGKPISFNGFKLVSEDPKNGRASFIVDKAACFTLSDEAIPSPSFYQFDLSWNGKVFNIDSISQENEDSDRYHVLRDWEKY